jgi:predicted Zn finger-like uncharacterized protein
MDTILTCQHCATKLKIKTAMLKVMKEVRCGKCRHLISLDPSVEASAEGHHAHEPAVPKPAPKAAGSPMISFACSKCARKISVLRSLAGKKIKCPGCAEVSLVPADGSEPAAPPPADAAAASGHPGTPDPAPMENPLSSPAPSAPPVSSAPLPAGATPVDPASREADPMAAFEARIRGLSEVIRRLQDDLAREGGEIADCAVQVETLKNRLSAIEQKGSAG